MKFLSGQGKEKSDVMVLITQGLRIMRFHHFDAPMKIHKYACFELNYNVKMPFTTKVPQIMSVNE